MYLRRQLCKAQKALFFGMEQRIDVLYQICSDHAVYISPRHHQKCSVGVWSGDFEKYHTVLGILHIHFKRQPSYNLFIQYLFLFCNS